MIQVERVSRRYGAFTAVDRVSFNVAHGEIVGLLGHNGAGKTTIMKMMTGFLEPSAGRIQVDGIDVEVEPRSVQERVGYLPETLPLYPEMTVIDYLDYTADLRGVPGERKPAAVVRAIERTDLADKALDPIATLSRGYRQRVGVAQAIIADPRVLILDEPTNGLDPNQTLDMRQLIAALAEHATVILSTHIMQEVNAICSRVLILRNGRLVLDESLDALKASERIVLVSDRSASELRELLDGLPGLGPPEGGSGESPQSGRHTVLLPIEHGADPYQAVDRICRRLSEAAVHIYAIHPEQRDLERVFREATEASGDLTDAA